MRVLIVNSFDKKGGAARAAFRLHEALLESGVDSIMLVQNSSKNHRLIHNPKTKIQKLAALIRPILDLRIVKYYRNRENVLFSSGLIPCSGIVKRIKEINPDIVHFHWVTNGMINIDDIKRIKSPIVWTLHDMWPFTGGCHYNNNCLGFKLKCGSCPILNSKNDKDLSFKIWKRKEKTYKQTSNMVVIGLSKWMTNCAKSSSLLKNKKIIHLPNPINTTTFAPFDSTHARKAFNLPYDKKLILFGAVGINKDRRKGFKELLKAMDNLEPNYELVIFGENEQSDNFPSKQKSHFIGSLDDDVSLKLLYCSVDVMVVPSLQENLSNVIMESMACGTPVVGFNIGGNSDMIEHLKTGYLAKPFDPEDLAKGIKWIIEKGNEMGISENNRKKVLLEFDSNLIAKRHLELYKQLTKE